MSKHHFATCDRGNESDPMDYWSEKTACGLEVYELEIELTEKEQFVTCKNCLKVLAKPINKTK